MVQTTLKMKHRMSKIGGNDLGSFNNEATEVLLLGLTGGLITPLAQAGVTCQKERKALKQASRFGFGTKQFRLLRKGDQMDVECRIWY